MTKKQKPLRELKRDTRRVVNDALASLLELEKETRAAGRTPSHIHDEILYATLCLGTAREYGIPWWKNS